VLVLPIFPARETDDLGVSNRTLAKAVGEKATAVDGFLEAAEIMKKAARPGDVMVVMGAGDVDRIFDYLGSSEGKT
ncbi:MAG: UDP-N-acetylmuramate--L-alanine ligase, partial [Clostridia bacterium]|nr:UDP-N-acetylmuramate--L-alanine ligase [Clostridia bacterium]